MIVAGALNFGGPATLPQGRNDTLVRLQRHADPHAPAATSMKAGGEYRHFINENFARGHRPVQLSRAWRRSWPEPPTPSASRSASGEASSPGRPVVLRSGRDRRRPDADARSRPALRVARHADRAGQPVRRVRRGDGVAGARRRRRRRDLSRRTTGTSSRASAWRGRSAATAARSCAPPTARAVDQPGTTAVRDTAGNPPFATPLTATGAIPLGNAIEPTRPAGLAPATVDPRFRNASLQSWNVNVQRQLARRPGRDGRLFRLARQPTCGSRATSISR